MSLYTYLRQWVGDWAKTMHPILICFGLCTNLRQEFQLRRSTARAFCAFPAGGLSWGSKKPRILGCPKVSLVRISTASILISCSLLFLMIHMIFRAVLPFSDISSRRNFELLSHVPLVSLATTCKDALTIWIVLGPFPRVLSSPWVTGAKILGTRSVVLHISVQFPGLEASLSRITRPWTIRGLSLAPPSLSLVLLVSIWISCDDGSAPPLFLMSPSFVSNQWKHITRP